MSQERRWWGTTGCNSRHVSKEAVSWNCHTHHCHSRKGRKEVAANFLDRVSWLTEGYPDRGVECGESAYENRSIVMPQFSVPMSSSWFQMFWLDVNFDGMYEEADVECKLSYHSLISRMINPDLVFFILDSRVSIRRVIMIMAEIWSFLCNILIYSLKAEWIEYILTTSISSLLLYFPLALTH